MLVVMSGRAPVRLIVPVTPVRSTVSVPPVLLPAAHSPATAPEAVLLFAAVIASRNVHKPSVPFAASDKLLTVMVASGVIPLLSGIATEVRDTDVEPARVGAPAF